MICRTSMKSCGMESSKWRGTDGIQGKVFSSELGTVPGRKHVTVAGCKPGTVAGSKSGTVVDVNECGRDRQEMEKCVTDVIGENALKKK